MSISQNIKSNKFITKIKKIKEYIIRMMQISNPYKIYFPYKTNLIHPAFDKLKNNPPIKYSNRKNAHLLHLVMGGSKKDLERNYILEIIDHAFSIIASYEVFIREPVEYYNRREKIKELYLSAKIKKIIFISNGQREIFKYYFPHNEILDKSVVMPLPWKDNIKIGKKEKTESIGFLFIASNFHTKGVAIVLKAWENFRYLDRTNATLTLVSHDIPKEVENKLHESIKLVKQAPLSSELKNKLYKNSDVVLALTLTDGITAIEGTSYGKPIIIYRTQHSKDFIDNENGVEIDVPINVYDVEKYGIVWKTKKEFDEVVKKYIKNGAFDSTIDGLVNTFSIYSEDRELLEKQTKNAIEKYYKDYTIENRNKKLLEIYNNVK
ncbi:glycosyltransferase [Celerinatantimonas yamalensis]|uniref:Glycosyltransferase n=1 Tax=Celerinatantimonas yamalensis TaxID=559956 RepID=A0ABW9G557_9GAMM